MAKKVIAIIGIALAVASLGRSWGFTPHQAIVAATFTMSILGVLFFWDLRLSFVFFGAGVLLVTHAVDLENFIRFASLDVILFLIGMMILVGMLNEAGVFFWIITALLRIKRLTGEMLFVILMVMSALFSGLMDEVTSIIIMTRIILGISDFFDISPFPLMMSSILATNIGSSSTVLGNPIGILIAARGNLSFEDFLRQAFPITSFVFCLTLIVLFYWHRKYIASINEKIAPMKENRFFLSLISVPTDRKTRVSILIFAATLTCIALHRRLELVFNLSENTLLLTIPIMAAGIVLFYRRDKMRYYVEHQVEWTSILFFLFLFAQAGVLKYSGLSDFLAKKFIGLIGNRPALLTGTILYSSGILSSVLDNTVVVASFVPMLYSLASLNVCIAPLWWAILFGACYGGNITVIGSTANIVAMGLLEKHNHRRIGFMEWLKIGLTVGIISMTAAYLLMLILHT